MTTFEGGSQDRRSFIRKTGALGAAGVVGGLAALRDRFDATTHVPVESDVSAEAADRRYGDGDAIDAFEAVHVPGHRADNYALIDETTGLLVAGDAAIGADWRGLPADHLLPPEAVYSDDPGAAEENLDSLLDYVFDAALVFHGSPVLEDAREKLDAYVHFPGRPS